MTSQKGKADCWRDEALVAKVYGGATTSDARTILSHSDALSVVFYTPLFDTKPVLRFHPSLFDSKVRIHSTRERRESPTSVAAVSNVSINDGGRAVGGR